MFLLYYRDFFEQICSDVQFISPPEEVGEFLQSVVKTGKYSYKEAVINELATASPSEYLTKISIQVF